MKRRSRRNWKIKLAEPKIHALAQQLVAEHSKLTLEGYRLMPSSGFWQTAGRGMTARFVYRHRAPDGVTTLTHIIHGIGA